MLSVVTLWIVFVVNFFALGVVWAYVARNYPKFEAARFWCSAAFTGSAGAAISILREFIPPLFPLLIAGTMLVMSCSLVVMGVERFYGRPISWRSLLSVVVLSFAGMSFFIWQPNAPMRVVIFSAGMVITIGMTVRLVLARPDGTRNPGAKLAGVIGALLVGMIALRAATMVRGIGGDASLTHFTALQAVLVLVLVFLSIAWNFGFLLMAIDRLRAEVAELALVDDLTGVANRRHLLARLSEECARSNRTLEPFVLLIIDLDHFKAINDNHGHSAGDASLRLFACAVQGRLRTGDLLARMGGDEFCAVLPSTTLREGAILARHLVEACRESTMHWNGVPIPMSASIGVAQWQPEMGSNAQELVIAADQALYMAKHDGRDRWALFEESDEASESLLRKSA